MTINAITVAASAPPKMRVTTNPDVVRLLSLLMHNPASAPAVGEKQISPGAHDAMSVVVATQVDFPEVVWQMEVDLIEVTEQVRGPGEIVSIILTF